MAQQERGNRAVALRALGEIAASEEPPDFGEAESRYRDALALAQEQELRPLQARCHLGLGKLLPARSAARTRPAPSWRRPSSMLREMGMAFWLPEAEAELAAGRLRSSAAHRLTIGTGPARRPVERPLIQIGPAA